MVELKIEDIKIEAIVKFNDHHAYVLNRMPSFKYEKHGSYLYASDGPFFSSYEYRPPSNAFQAFAGREFDLQMLDGTATKCKGQYWDCGNSWANELLGIQIVDVTIKTIKQLKECYVFYGSSMQKEVLEKLISEYDGVIYEYRDYEMVINYKDMRSKFWKREMEADKAKGYLIEKVRLLTAEVKGLELLLGNTVFGET